MPKVSVIIPVYNRARLIGKAIQSVLNQSYREFEIVVINDGSIDATESVIKKYQKSDKRIHYICHEKNKGAAAARNTGVKNATGEYIAFQDSDDEWLPEKLEKQLAVFRNASPEVGIVYSDMWAVTEKGKKYFYSSRIMSGNRIKYREALGYGVMNIGIGTALIRRECFDKVGMFDEKLPRFIDLEFFIRLSKYYYFCRIAEPLVKYFDTDRQRISSSRAARAEARELILKKYFHDIKTDRKLLAKHYYGISIDLRSTGNFRKGRDYLVKTVKANPLNIKILFLLMLSFLGEDIYNRISINFKQYFIL